MITEEQNRMNQRTPLKVVHIFTFLTGGAGLCASRIMEATRKLGVDARAIVAIGNKSEYVDIIEEQILWMRLPFLKKSKILMKAHTWLSQNRRISKVRKSVKYHIVFSSPVTHYTNIIDHPWVKEADIIHLHYIGDFVDYKSFFTNIKQPIVWTMHDQNPGLGGLHFQKWKDEGSSKLKRLDDKMLSIKKIAYDHVRSMTLVAISSEMDEYAKSNTLLCRFPRVKIFNGIDGKAFSPIDRQTAREVLNIPQDRIVFLFSAVYVLDERKGLRLLIDALHRLNIPNIVLICVGYYEYVPDASFEIRCEGFVSNSRLQSIYYSAADYYIQPSFLEAFAQTPMEAMACGTPVVSFPCSGAHDLITDKNGVVCDGFTSESLMRGIKSVMSQEYDREEIRKDLLERYSYEIVGKQYVKLYSDLM